MCLCRDVAILSLFACRETRIAIAYPRGLHDTATGRSERMKDRVFIKDPMLFKFSGNSRSRGIQSGSYHTHGMISSDMYKDINTVFECEMFT